MTIQTTTKEWKKMSLKFVGATTKKIPATNTKPARIRVTVSNDSKIVPLDYGATNEHVAAIYDAFPFFNHGAIASVDFVAVSESGAGNVYTVMYRETVDIWKIFEIDLNYDGGKTTLVMNATSAERAIDLVMALEKCPRRSITNIREV